MQSRIYRPAVRGIPKKPEWNKLWVESMGYTLYLPVDGLGKWLWYKSSSDFWLDYPTILPNPDWFIPEWMDPVLLKGLPTEVVMPFEISEIKKAEAVALLPTKRSYWKQIIDSLKLVRWH